MKLISDGHILREKHQSVTSRNMVVRYSTQEIQCMHEGMPIWIESTHCLQSQSTPDEGFISNIAFLFYFALITLISGKAENKWKTRTYQSHVLSHWGKSWSLLKHEKWVEAGKVPRSTESVLLEAKSKLLEVGKTPKFSKSSFKGVSEAQAETLSEVGGKSRWKEKLGA